MSEIQKIFIVGEPVNEYGLLPNTCIQNPEDEKYWYARYVSNGFDTACIAHNEFCKHSLEIIIILDSIENIAKQILNNPGPHKVLIDIHELPSRENKRIKEMIGNKSNELILKQANEWKNPLYSNITTIAKELNTLLLKADLSYEERSKIEILPCDFSSTSKINIANIITNYIQINPKQESA